MSKQCNICRRSAMKGAIRSHSNIKINKRQNINLHNRKVEGGKIKICGTCLKTVKKNDK